MIGALCQAGGKYAGAIKTSISPSDEIGLGWFAIGDGSSFVERQPFQFSALFQIDPALDQDAMPCGISRPRRAPADRPEVIAAGVEMTSAHGQAITSRTKAR